MMVSQTHQPQTNYIKRSTWVKFIIGKLIFLKNSILNLGFPLNMVKQKWSGSDKPAVELFLQVILCVENKAVLNFPCRWMQR